MPDSEGQAPRAEPAKPERRGGANRMAVQRFEVKIDQLRSRIRKIEREIKIIARQRLEFLGSDEGFLSVVPTEDEMIGALLRRSDRLSDALRSLLDETNAIRQADGQMALELHEVIDLGDLTQPGAGDGEALLSNPEQLAKRCDDLLSFVTRLEGEIDELGKLAVENMELRELTEELRRRKREIMAGGADASAELAQECRNLQGELEITRVAVDVLKEECKSLRARSEVMTQESEELKERNRRLAASGATEAGNEKVKSLETEIEGLRGESTTLARALEKALADRAGIEARLQQTRELVATAGSADSGNAQALRRELDRVTRELADTQAELRRQKEGFNSLIQEATRDKQSAANAGESIKKQEDAVAALGTEMDRIRIELEEERKARGAAEGRIADTEQALAEAERAAASLDDQVAENETLVKALERARQQKNEFEEQLERARNETNAVRGQARGVEEASLNVGLELDSLKRKVDTLTGQLDRRGAIVAKLEEDLDRTRAETAEAERERRTAEAERDRIRGELETGPSGASADAAQQEELKKVRAQLEKVQADRDRLRKDAARREVGPPAALRPMTGIPVPKRGGKLPQIQGFEVLAEVGCGPSGWVLQVRKEGSERIAAFKLLDERLAGDDFYMDRVSKVIPTLGRSKNPNLLRQIFPGRLGGHTPIAMDFLESGSLATRLAGEGRIDEAEAIRISLQIARALEDIHAADLVHRNLKPTNILFGDGGEVQVADAGLASGEDDGAFFPEAGQVWHYGSPEVVRGVRSPDLAVDVYGVGALLYHMVTGAAPFMAESSVGVRAQQQTGQAPWPCEIHGGVSEATAHLIVRLMARDQAQRPANSSALKVDLERAADGELPVAGPCRAGESCVAVA